jgi:hypothetical protein
MVLVLICLIFVAVVLTILLIRPEIFQTTDLFSDRELNDLEDKNNEEEKLISKFNCPIPYLLVGNSCCLDSNNNRICDNDESYSDDIVSQKCYYPYVKIGSNCCIDDNDNRVCDNDETDKDRITSKDIDSPFDISSVDVSKYEISFRLKNDGNDDLIILTIDLEDCDIEEQNYTLKVDNRKTFSLDCDFDYGSFNSDLTVEYRIVGSNITETADGRIKGYIGRR